MIRPSAAHPDPGPQRITSPAALPHDEPAPHQSFQAVLREMTPPPKAAQVAAFDETGVLGRHYAQTTPATPRLSPSRFSNQSVEHALSATRVRSSSQPSPDEIPAPSRFYETDANEAAPVAKPADTRTAGAPNNSAGPTVLNTKTSVNTGKPRAVTAPPLRSVRAPASPRTPLSLVMHASDSGVSVFARAGRMAATARERLRQALRALLTEKGVTAKHITLDGESDQAQQGETHSWPR